MKKTILIFILLGIAFKGYLQPIYFNNRYEGITDWWDGARGIVETDSFYILG